MLVLCLSGLGIALLPEGRRHEAGLASESQHQQQPVCLHEGESSQDQLSAVHSTAELRMRQQKQRVDSTAERTWQLLFGPRSPCCQTFDTIVS